MTLKSIITSLLLMIGLSAFIVACNNKSKSFAGSCPSGQVATPVGCSLNGNTKPIGYIPPINGTYQYYSSRNDFLAPMDSLNPSELYPQFLENALEVCNRCSNSGGGTLTCESWMNGFNMLMLSLSPNTTLKHQMAFYSTPQASMNSGVFAWQFPDAGDFFINLFTGAPSPSCNYGQFSPYWATDVLYDSHNSGAGFVLYVNQGPFYSNWNLYKFRLYIPNGKPGDSQFDYQLEVVPKNGSPSVLATGTLHRCVTPNCKMF